MKLQGGYSGDVVFLGSKDTNNMVFGSKYCHIHGIGALKPYYLGPWTLRVCHLTPVSLKANSWTLHCWKFTDCIEPLNSTIYNEERSRGLGKDSPNPTLPRVEIVWGRNSVFAQLKYYKVVPPRHSTGCGAHIPFIRIPTLRLKRLPVQP